MAFCFAYWEWVKDERAMASVRPSVRLKDEQRQAKVQLWHSRGAALSEDQGRSTTAGFASLLLRL